VGEGGWLSSVCPLARLHSSALPPSAFIEGLRSGVGKTESAESQRLFHTFWREAQILQRMIFSTKYKNLEFQGW
jgi:hypothetical protein